MDGSTSISLLDRVRHRDDAAWQRLVYLYAPLVAHWCQAWGVRGADTDDLIQEVFKSVATGMAHFRHEQAGDTFRGWLRVITRRKLLDHRRKTDRQPAAEGGSDAHHRLEQVGQPEEADDPPEEVKRLHHRALELIRSQFEEKTWRAFWLCAVDGRSPVDVGAELGLSTAAVRKAKSRVLLRLKAELGDLLG